MTPLGARILVRPTPPAESSRGGIIIPEAFRDTMHQGTIVAVGPKVTPELRPGAVILHGNWAGTEIVLDRDPMLMVAEGDVLGIVGE